MYKLLLSFFIVFIFFLGCSTKVAAPNEKSFDEEDTYIMYALYAQQRGAEATAAQMYGELYQRSGKKEYLYERESSLLRARKPEVVIVETQTFLEDDPHDYKLRRYEIAGLLQEDEVNKAKKRALELVGLTKSVNDYVTVSNIYSRQKRYDTALKYLERAYAINYDEDILDQMSILLYVNLNRKSEAIAQLETHSRLHGCSEKICIRLGSYYSEQNNIDGMLSTYLRLYDAHPTKEMSDHIIKIYNYQKDYVKLQLFLQENHLNDALLLQLYVKSKEYKKASELALKLYKEEGDINYLGQSAIFDYEGTKEHSDTSLQSVIKRLEKVIEKEHAALYLNYLGYLMIEHDINVDEGIIYVKEALKQEPDSAYYVDSLAWGYYKQNRCAEAYKLMKKVKENIGSDDAEVKAHIKAINKCNKGKKQL